MLAKWIVSKHTGMGCSTVRQPARVHADKRVEICDRELLHLVVQLLDEFGPVFETNLEDFPIVYLRNPDKIEMGLYEKILVR